MTAVITITKDDLGFAFSIAGKSLQTPGKQALIVPTQALADAIAVEWKAHGKFSATHMPLTSLAYTAIDRIAPAKEAVTEALLVYIDTDTLCYRANGSEKLAQLQDEKWGAVLSWAAIRFDAGWAVTQGVMPVDQSPQLHEAIGKYLRTLDDMRLAAACILASGYSSLALMLAVMEKKLSADEAFRLSRLEEESQAEIWGRDDEAEKRAKRLKEEIIAAGCFLDLLVAV